ncbi:MAG: hypothetical protein F4Y01_04465, partial [Gammaproteobacteria bacterium]|nr:hypothetical protein [Gammaproteobacteria bacterium]
MAQPRELQLLPGTDRSGDDLPRREGVPEGGGNGRADRGHGTLTPRGPSLEGATLGGRAPWPPGAPPAPPNPSLRSASGPSPHLIGALSAKTLEVCPASLRPTAARIRLRAFRRVGGRDALPPKKVRLALALAGLAIVADGAYAASTPCVDPDYRHGISYVEPLHYGPEFRHFDYANPDAPKGGRIRLPQMGTFDNFNAIVEAGRMAAGYGAMGSLVYDTMLEDTIDEPASAYLRLADGVAVERDYRWVAFRLRAGARWHDGRPITTEDVAFTFDAIREHGSVALRTALADLDRIETFGERELCFVTRPDAEPNPILPFQYG